MSISEKLTTIAENEQKVFNAPIEYTISLCDDYINYGTPQKINTAEKYTALNNKIDELNTTAYDVGCSDGRLNGYSEGFDDGKRNGESTFLNMLSNNNNRKNYYGVFASSNLEGYTFPYTIKPGDIGRMFYVYVGKKMPKNIDFSQAKESTGGYYQTFCWADVLEEIYFNAPAPTGQYNMTFSYCRKAVEIDRVNVLQQTTFSQAFLQCYALEELTIGGTIAQNGFSLSDSKQLSKASLLSVLNALNATVSGITVTFASKCIDGNVDTLTTIQRDTELNSAYTAALNKGYSISFV